MVEDFPEPVGPVTSTMPFLKLAISASGGGSLSSAKLGMLLGITRITMAWLPRCIKTFTRNRHLPGRLYDMSHDPWSFSADMACLLPHMSSCAIRLVSSGDRNWSCGIGTGTNLPLTSTCGRLPGEKIRSLTRSETCSIANNNAGVGIAGLIGATVFTAGGLTSVSKVCCLSTCSLRFVSAALK